MRSLLLICSFFAGLTGFSQDTLATFFSHDWAAGQCCSSGTDVSFTLSDKLSPSDFDSLVYISSVNSRTVFYPADFHTQGSDQKSNYMVSYGWNSGGSGKTVCYGLPENRFSVVKHQPAHLLIYKGNGKPAPAFVREEFKITTYP